MKHIVYLLTLILLLISTCAVPLPNATLLPIPSITHSASPAPTSTLVPVPIYSGYLRSPDGTIRAEVKCYQGYMQWHCENYFPTGNVLYGELALFQQAERWWSPDGIFAVVCTGQTHDSPCNGYQVWNVVNGTIEREFHSRIFKWSPNQDHILVYLVEYQILGVPDDLIEFDPGTGSETVLQECPLWFYSDAQQTCPTSPGVVVGGRVVGLPEGAQAVIQTYALDEGEVLRGYQTVERDGGSWQQLLRYSFGKSFRITISCADYIGNPTAYNLYLDDAQVYLIRDWRREIIKPNSLDFVLESR